MTKPLNEYNEYELEALSTDNENFPYLKMRGGLSWNGTSWVKSGGGLVPDSYDYIALTYVATGNGEGEPETVEYYTGGAGGTLVATLTLTYNSIDEVATVTKS